MSDFTHISVYFMHIEGLKDRTHATLAIPWLLRLKEGHNTAIFMHISLDTHIIGTTGDTHIHTTYKKKE